MPDLEPALRSTYFVDCDEPRVAEFAAARTKGASSLRQAAVNLFYAVRDEILYDLLKAGLNAAEFKASITLERGFGFCVPKAVLLTACCRSAGIPCRLRFADVRNHLTEDWLLELMGTDLFIYHGYVEIFMDGKWIKATPAFDKGLCARHGVRPIEFDGAHDAIFHEFDLKEKRHMEYVRDRGVFYDLPYDSIVKNLKEAYPRIHRKIEGSRY